MAKIRVTLPELHKEQIIVRDDASRFKILAWGRRSGKTHLASALAAETALKGGLAWWVAPTYDVARIGWRLVNGIADQIPGCVIRKADREIWFPGGGRTTIRSADGQKSLRGEGVDRLIIDDCAFMDEERWIADLRPSLSDKEGEAVLISTPNGRTWFYELYLRGQDSEFPDWSSWQRSTYCNPFVKNSEIDIAKKELPDWVFSQEYLAEFITFEGRVYKTFDPAGPCVFGEETGLEYVEHWGGIDPGFRNPFCAVVAGEYDGGLDCREEIYETGLTPPVIIGLIRDLQAKYNVRHWFCDPSDPSLIQELQIAGIPVSPAPRPKGHLEESWVKTGIIEVEKLLCADPPALRFYRVKCPNVIQEFDRYRYPKKRADSYEKERPLKVDDHGPDATRYMIVGWIAMRSLTGEVIII